MLVSYSHALPISSHQSSSSTFLSSSSHDLAALITIICPGGVGRFFVLLGRSAHRVVGGV